MKRIVQYTIIAIVAILILVSFFLGGIVKNAIETYGPQIAGVPITVDDVSINAIAGNVSIRNLVIGNPKGFKSDHSMALDAITVDLNMMSLLSDRIKINRIHIIRPQINYELGLGGTNISALSKQISAGGSTSPSSNEPKSEGSSKTIEITELYIKKATVKAGIGAAVAGAEIELPTIHLTDIGKEDNNGTSFAEAANLVMTAITSQIAQADLSEVTGQLKDAGKNVGKAIKGVGDKLKGLF